MSISLKEHQIKLINVHKTIYLGNCQIIFNWADCYIRSVHTGSGLKNEDTKIFLSLVILSMSFWETRRPLSTRPGQEQTREETWSSSMLTALGGTWALWSSDAELAFENKMMIIMGKLFFSSQFQVVAFSWVVRQYVEWFWRSSNV